MGAGAVVAAAVAADVDVRGAVDVEPVAAFAPIHAVGSSTKREIQVLPTEVQYIPAC